MTYLLNLNISTYSRNLCPRIRIDLIAGLVPLTQISGVSFRRVFYLSRHVIGVKDMGYRERRSYDRGPREMHKITCSDCGEEAEVPFKPTEGRPVYCQECFKKHRPPRRY